MKKFLSSKSIILSRKSVAIGSVILFLFDRILKYLALRSFDSEGFLVCVRNSKNLFGLVGGAGRWPFIVVSAGVLLWLGLVFFVPEKKYQRRGSFFLVSALIFTGGVSNTLDRSYYGFVVDYFNVFISYLNLADIYVSIGVFYALFLSFGQVRK